MTDSRRSSRGKSGSKAKGASTVKARIEFVDLGDREAPRLRAEVLAPSGERSELEVQPDGAFELDPKQVGQGLVVRIAAEDGSSPRRYRYDSLVERLQEDDLLPLAPSIWGDWFKVRTCVSGSVRVCRPLFTLADDLHVDTSMSSAIRQVRVGSTAQLEELILGPEVLGRLPELAPYPFERCLPVCHGKVEVFLRTCCCDEIGVFDPPRVIEDLCEIIDCPPIPDPWPPVPPWPPLPPIPPPPPVGPVGPEVLEGMQPPVRDLAAGGAVPTADVFERNATLLERRSNIVSGTAKVLKRAGSEVEMAEIVEAARHLRKLIELPTRAAQVEYIQLHPWLRWRLCTCEAEKVTEAELGPDGSFDTCFSRPVFLESGCTQTVTYRVSQLQEGSWVVVYDGAARGEAFGFNDDAVLDAGAQALACDEPWDYPDDIPPFVALEKIGHTGSHNLIPVTVPGPNPDPQNGETSFVPLQPDYGLVHEAPSGSPSLSTGPYEQPWAGTLRLYYQFHPGLEAAPLNAKYFRTRIVRVNDSGNAISEFVHTGNLSWEKWFFDGTEYRTKWVPLHTDPSVVGQPGLYEIPFHDAVEPWVGLQWHARIDTLAKNGDGSRKMPDGRYLFVVDIFDASGNRLVPADGFEYRRRTASSSSPVTNTRVVNQNALAHLFLVDNVPAVADLEALKQDGGTPSGVNCQYLTGTKDSELQIQYEAQQATGYQWRHWLRVRKGLHGPNRFVSDAGIGLSASSVYSNTDMPGGTGSLTYPASFEFLMNSPAASKCTFATTLWIETKHTNGMARRIDAYDRQDTGSFSLEITS